LRLPYKSEFDITDEPWQDDGFFEPSTSPPTTSESPRPPKPRALCEVVRPAGDRRQGRGKGDPPGRSPSQLLRPRSASSRQWALGSLAVAVLAASFAGGELVSQDSVESAQKPRANKSTARRRELDSSEAGADAQQPPTPRRTGARKRRVASSSRRLEHVASAPGPRASARPTVTAAPRRVSQPASQLLSPTRRRSAAPTTVAQAGEAEREFGFER
jgi:hypothetical protein